MEAETPPPAPKKRGPKPGSKRVTKIKLKPQPKNTRQDILKKYKSVTDWGIYGIDDFTLEVINHLWKNPEITFHVSDTKESRLDNANRIFGQRSFSMYRWEVYPPSGFIEECPTDIILCSKELYPEACSRPNPYNVKIILLEDV